MKASRGAEEKQTLRELMQASHNVSMKLVESGGEITPEIDAISKNVDIELPQKIDSYAHLIETSELNEKYFAKMRDEYAALARGCKNFREQLKDNLKSALISNDVELVTGFESSFKVYPLQSKVVIDPTTLDPAYTMQVTKTEIDKDRVEEILRAGGEIKGAWLEPVYAIKKGLVRGVK